MDDSPICVVDATTLVDHIQDIKRFVYGGRMCLVVPLRSTCLFCLRSTDCTKLTLTKASTPLEQIYAKLTEEANKKPSRQPEPQRPRSSGRPAKVEKSTKVGQPAVDINPLVAGEFLARLRSNETQKGVEFQKEGEQYSPWRLLEMEEESRNANEDKPTSFAQAARKASVEKFSSAAGAVNGPAKPRLVARSAGLDSSPWKMSHKALSLPISDVPKDMRPLLSCLLWRVHEKGATLWDTNRTFLLCDDEKTKIIAKKLGIMTKSFKELRKTCDMKGVTEDRRITFGNLEEHFNIPEVPMAKTSHDGGIKSKIRSTLPALDQPLKDKVDASGAPDQTRSPLLSSAPEGITKSASSPDKSKSERHNASFDQPQEQETPKHSVDGPQSTINESHEHPTAIPSEHPTNEIPSLELPNVATHVPYEEAVRQPSKPVFSTLAIDKEHSIAEWVKGLMDAGSNGELSGRDTPVSGYSAIMEATAQQPEKIEVFKPMSYLQAVTGKANDVAKKQLPSQSKESIPSPRVSPARETSPPALEDPLDSEEEILVFNPKAKRLSAQKAQQAQQTQLAQQAQQAKQLQQAQRPHHSQQTPQAPQSQQSQRPQTPKSSPRHSHTRRGSGGRAHVRGGSQRQARSGPPPVVIDPDSFGRGLVTNAPPALARTFSPYGAHGRVTGDRRGNHRSPHSQAAAQNVPSKVNGAMMPNGSVHLATQSTADQPSATIGPANAESAPGVQAPTMTTPPTLLRPSLMTNGSHAEPSLQSSNPVMNGFQAQSNTSLPVRADKPRYSPRGSPRRAPALPDPEVAYVLRSGQPREATRGKGKLWVP
ncbi:MAG: hypothetical protein L6R35_001476 [Caloplaca aegaea]|nr:MAG: hypothetical protein L6R35_001476 [Caloplaca aegaea]